jgi:hypothetical protein
MRGLAPHQEGSDADSIRDRLEPMPRLSDELATGERQLNERQTRHHRPPVRCHKG